MGPTERRSYRRPGHNEIAPAQTIIPTPFKFSAYEDAQIQAELWVINCGIIEHISDRTRNEKGWSNAKTLAKYYSKPIADREFSVQISILNN